MKTSMVAALLLLSGTTASFAINQPPTKLDPQNLRIYSHEMTQQAALDQARRDTGTGLEGPSMGDGQNGSQTASLDREGYPSQRSDNGYTITDGYTGEM